jgi:hypothetical protein
MPKRLCAFAFGGGVDDNSGDPEHAASADAAASATINPHLVLLLRIELHCLIVWILTALILTAWIALVIIASPVAASRFIDLAEEVKTESKRQPAPLPGIARAQVCPSLRPRAIRMAARQVIRADAH